MKRLISILLIAALMLNIFGALAFANTDSIKLTQNPAHTFELQPEEVFVPYNVDSEIHNLRHRSEGKLNSRGGELYYNYLGYRKGNTAWDTYLYGASLGVVGVMPIPYLGITALVVGLLSQFGLTADQVAGKTLQGSYIEYIYECTNPSPYPYIFRHNFDFYSEAGVYTGYLGSQIYMEYALLPR